MGDDISEAALRVALVDSELLHRVLVQIPFRLEAALTDRDHGIRASTISALHCRMMIMTILIVQGVSKKLVHFARRYI